MRFYLSLMTKTVLVVIAYLPLAVLSFAQSLEHRLLYIKPNHSIVQYNNFTVVQKEQWFKQHLASITDAEDKNLLLAATHLYVNKEYKKSDHQINLLLNKLSNSAPSLLVANAYYFKAINTSMGLRQFESSISIFEKTIHILENLEQKQSSQSTTLLSIAANYRLGSLYLFLNQPSQAKSFIVKAIDSATSLNDNQYLLIPTLELAKYYIAVNEQDLAEAHLIKSYNLALETKHDNISYILQQLSKFYRKNKQFELAIDYAIQAVKYYKTKPEKVSALAAAYNNLAVTYEEAGDLNKAFVHYLNTVKITENSPHNYFYALATHNIGLIYQKQGKFTQALQYLNTANRNFLTMGHHYFLMSNNLSTANVLVDLKEFTQAITYAEKALEYAQKQSQVEIELESLELLSQIYVKNKQFKKATEALNQWMVIQKQNTIKLNNKLNSRPEKSNVDSSNNVNLQTKMITFKSKINELDLIIAQQQRTLSTFELYLWFTFIGTLIGIFWLYRTKKEKECALLLANTHCTTQIITLHDEKSFLMVVNNELLKKQYVISFKLSIFNDLLNFMGLENSNHFKANIIHDINQHLDTALYQISEDTFVFAMTPATNKTIEEYFISLVTYYRSLIPESLQQLDSKHSLLLGGMKLHSEQSSANLIQAKNIINLTLTALSVVNANQDKNFTKNWLILSEKEKRPMALFTCSTRKELLIKAQNKMLLVKTGLTEEISWLSTPHFTESITLKKHTTLNAKNNLND